MKGQLRPQTRRQRRAAGRPVNPKAIPMAKVALALAAVLVAGLLAAALAGCQDRPRDTRGDDLTVTIGRSPEGEAYNDGRAAAYIEGHEYIDSLRAEWEAERRLLIDRNETLAEQYDQDMYTLVISYETVLDSLRRRVALQVPARPWVSLEAAQEMSNEIDSLHRVIARMKKGATR